MRYLPRPRELQAVRAGLRRAPITTLLGPRQCGKTTLARSLKAEHFLDLEDPRNLARLDEPQTALETLTGMVVIDEVQRKPELFPLLRVLADRQRSTRYLLVGSASPELVKVSESLAGRVAYHDLGPFAVDETVDETGTASGAGCGCAGGFPEAIFPKTTLPPLRGGKISSAATWNAISPPSEFPFRRRHCVDSG